MFSLVPSLTILLCGAAFITAQTLPPGSCSATVPCPANQCCSQWGFCGTGSAYCGTGSVTTTAPPTTQQITAPPTTQQNTPASPTTALPPGSCSASVPCPTGQCCSQWGFCGTGSSYCGAATSSPTSVQPTTLPPTSAQPTTLPPTSVQPTTQSVTTAPPTTQAATTLPPTTVVGTTNAPPTTPPPVQGAPIKALYLESNINWNDPGSTVRQAVDDGYNLIVLAFYLTTGPCSCDMAGLWGGLSQSEQQSVVGYAHNAGAKITISFGGDTVSGYDSLSASNMGTSVAQWAVQNNLDGVDFDLEHFSRGFTYNSMTSAQVIQWIADATNAARSVLGTSRIITHAPVAPYFGPLPGDSSYFTETSGGYNAVYALAPSIDYFLVQYYNQDCYTDYTTVFQSSGGKCNGDTSGNLYPGTSVAEITSYTVNGHQIPLSKIVVGKPVLSSDAGSDYVDPTTLHQWFTSAQANIGWNTGVMGWQWHDSTTNANWIHTVYP